MHVLTLRPGLTNFEADLRVAAYGRNEFTAPEEDPLWQKYMEQVGSCGLLASMLVGGKSLLGLLALILRWR